MKNKNIPQTPQSFSPVALTACSGYDEPVLSQALEHLLKSIELPITPHGAEVLLKPNLISAKTGPLACTEGALILAVARRFLDQGARVSIGDSPAFGTATAVLRNLNLLDELAHLGVRIRSFKQGVSVDLPDGGGAILARAALESDLLINLPRVKAHVQARLTLAVKNYFGCVVGLRKAWWHMEYGGEQSHKPGGFFDRLIRIQAAFPASLNITDGIVAMHRTGPVHGVPYPLSVLAVSTDAVAVDRAVHAVLQVDPRTSPVMAACRRAGLQGASLSQLVFPSAAPEELQVDDFQVPGELNPVRFNPFRFLLSSVRRFFMGRGEMA